MQSAPERVAAREGGLKRALGSWQQALIAIGGTVGVGLFLGSGATIGLAGPGVILTYLLAGAVALFLGGAIAEMASVYPVTGSFGVYAERYIGAWAGFITRLTYWFAEALAIGAQVTAVGLYFGFWFPEAPAWIFMSLAAGFALAINAFHVRRFGTLESSFSLVKVTAIVAFIVLGGALLLRGAGAGPEGSHLLAHGGLLPHGWAGVWLALTLVITSFIGVEVVAVTAGEAERPERTVPRALLGMTLALIVLYVLAITTIVSLTPWQTIAETGGALTASPFVRVFEQAGIPYAAGVMNVVVISAAATAVITNLYLCTRMLFSLSRDGYVPAALGAVDRRGVPVPALAASTAGMALAILLASEGRHVFLPIYGTAVAALLSLWIAILVCHLRFRRSLTPAQLATLPLRVPGHPLPTIAAMAVIAAVLASTPWVEGLEWSVPLFLVWLLGATALYWVTPKSRIAARRGLPLSSPET